MRNLKRVLSLALALVMVLGMMVISSSAATYTDADEITYTEAVAVMTGVGLYEGYDDGSLKPTEVLTREQAATLITRIMLGDIAETLKPTKQIFTDVPTTKWSAAAIEYCYNIGMIAGMGDGTFDPSGKLTGTAFAKLLLCAMGYDAGAAGYEGSAWQQNINADALANGLTIDGVKITDDLTREQAAQMVLQALDCGMVYYYNSYDYATGAHTVVGPVPAGKTFVTNYYWTLTKSYTEYATWGRPYEYVWFYQGEVIYSVAKTPVLTYTVGTYECDVAEELGLKGDAKIVKWTHNNKDVPVSHKEVVDEVEYIVHDEYIELLGTKAEMGAQGRLLEIYKKGYAYEIVEIDTYLAQVTDVTECTYDRNGHLDDPAILSLDVYFDSDEADGMFLTSNKDWDYKTGDWQLVYVNEKTGKPVLMGTPDTLTGAQTAWTYNNETHEVEDTEYNDAVNFYLDETKRINTEDYIWFFDLYNNLIGAIEPDAAPSTYGVVSDIYWEDTDAGEPGYAYAKITYLDGTSEWQTVYSIDGVVLEGIEGNNAKVYTDEWDTTYMLVSSTKQYNKKAFTNTALYELAPSKNGLKLTSTTKVLEGEGNLITGQKTVVDGDVYVNSKTMFLAYNSKKGTYTAYVGVRNLPEYNNIGKEMWVADVTEDTNAEYVFIVDPDTKTAASEVDMVVVLTDDAMKMKANLKDNAIVSYKYSNILVDGEIGAVVFDADPEYDYLIEEFEANMGIPMVLEITDGVVTDVLTSAKHREVNEKPVETFGKVGELGVKCEYEADDESLYVGGKWYDVADATLIGAPRNSWKYAEGMEVAIVYDEDGIVSFVYFYEA